MHHHNIIRNPVTNCRKIIFYSLNLKCDHQNAFNIKLMYLRQFATFVSYLHKKMFVHPKYQMNIPDISQYYINMAQQK